LQKIASYVGLRPQTPHWGALLPTSSSTTPVEPDSQILELHLTTEKFLSLDLSTETEPKLEMWANAQRDGRPAEHRWRPLFNAANFG